MILLCAVVLANLKLQWIPRPVILGVTVVVSCVLALHLHYWLGFSSAPPLGLAIHKLRVLVLQWGLVAAVYYFIERSARRAAELRGAELDRHRIEAQMLETQLQVMSTCASVLNNSPARWPALPLLPEPKDNLPGFALA